MKAVGSNFDAEFAFSSEQIFWCQESLEEILGDKIPCTRQWHLQEHEKGKAEENGQEMGWNGMAPCFE